MAAVVVAGFLPPDWPDDARQVRFVVGAGLVVVGAAFGVWAGRELGRALTPFPKPRPVGLVTTGPFGVVRHPIYLGFLGVFVGYGLLTGVLALALVGALGVLWVGKTRVEERLLSDVYARLRRVLRARRRLAASRSPTCTRAVTRLQSLDVLARSRRTRRSLSPRSRGRGSARGVRERRLPRRRLRPTRSAARWSRSSSRSCSSAARRRCWRSCPATAGPTRRRSPWPRRRGEARVARPPRSSR